MNDKDAKRLTDRFFDGKTTVEEERRLYAYFSSPEVDEELLPFRQMFLDFSGVQLDGVSHTLPSRPRSPRHKWMGRVAAAALLLVLTGAGVVAYQNNNECEMMVYGKRMTDREAVMDEVELNMDGMCQPMRQVDHELETAFGL